MHDSSGSVIRINLRTFYGGGRLGDDTRSQRCGLSIVLSLLLAFEFLCFCLVYSPVRYVFRVELGDEADQCGRGAIHALIRSFPVDFVIGRKRWESMI